MKNIKIKVLLLIVLAVAAIVLILNQSGSSLKKDLSDFAVEDTTHITRIFMADKMNRSIILERKDSAHWIVNGRFAAQQKNINTLLKTLRNLEVWEPVSKAGHNTIIKDMAASSVKVEIYQQVYRIDLFGKIRWFPHEKCTKVYYVGGPTPDNRGTFMLMENSTTPYITYLPSLRGFVSAIYSTRENDWRDFTIFRTPLAEIAAVTIEFPLEPSLSYSMEPQGPGIITLKQLQTGSIIHAYDTVKVYNFLTSFRKLGYEAMLTGFDPLKKDSILSSPPFITLTLLEKSGKKTAVKAFRKPAFPGELDLEGIPVIYDRDRFYLLLEDTQEFVLAQFFTFERVLRPITYFEKISSNN